VSGGVAVFQVQDVDIRRAKGAGGIG
jgi:hypothetical protein